MALDRVQAMMEAQKEELSHMRVEHAGLRAELDALLGCLHSRGTITKRDLYDEMARQRGHRSLVSGASCNSESGTSAGGMGSSTLAGDRAAIEAPTRLSPVAGPSSAEDSEWRPALRWVRDARREPSDASPGPGLDPTEQRCTECLAQEKLKPDPDQPSKFYCGMCWEVWETTKSSLVPDENQLEADDHEPEPRCESLHISPNDVPEPEADSIADNCEQAKPTSTKRMAWADVRSDSEGETGETNTRAARTEATKRRGALGCKEERPVQKEPAALAQPLSAPRGSACRDECAKLTLKLKAGSDERADALAALRESVVPFSLDPSGCRVVQLAIATASQSEAACLVAGLHGHVFEASQSPHANFVIQKVIEVLPLKLSSFVAEELHGMVTSLARTRFGCRIPCRLLEHTLDSKMTVLLADEIAANTIELSRHSFGHHVIRSTLEHGLPRHRKRIAESLVEDVRESCTKKASDLLQLALMRCGTDQSILASRLLLEDSLVSLAQHEFGVPILQLLLQLPGDVPQMVRARVRAVAAQLQGSKHGMRILQSLSDPPPPNAQGVKRSDGPG
eukprot:CAMPEP_0170603882 /NCGR_PEP_ID=MMETSP0224-20130122/19139_1 /TAXON_ID=285029 /ORGANISM="Togula jolla, Strain CCCM 725" /LENGTH=565 /DNA_ID=CAMNT_0010928773 /DNA_START=44 /DNA_END=1741 /DNA_ORIENTATION=+